MSLLKSKSRSFIPLLLIMAGTVALVYFYQFRESRNFRHMVYVAPLCFVSAFLINSIICGPMFKVKDKEK
jgi:hypothetical protein